MGPTSSRWEEALNEAIDKRRAKDSGDHHVSDKSKREPYVTLSDLVLQQDCLNDFDSLVRRSY